MEYRRPFAQSQNAVIDRARSFVVTGDGVHLRYQDWGQGKPIVFVHSWAMNSDMWQYNAFDFEERGFRCVAFDRRGHGASDRPRDGYTLERLASDLGELLEALDLTEVTLVGHSLGGAECVKYLERAGAGRVSRLVLLAPATPFLRRADDNPRGVDPALAVATQKLWAADFPRWLDAGAEDFYRPSVFGIHSGIVEWTKRMLDATPIQVVFRTGAVLFEADLRGALRTLEVPTLVIHGDHDRSIPVEFGRATAELSPNFRYREYPGAPHGLYLTHRQQVRDDILQFMAETLGPSLNAAPAALPG